MGYPMKTLKPMLYLTLCLASCGGFAVTVDEELKHDIRPGAGIAAVKHLSDYLPALAKTPGDSLVYVLDGEEKGGTVLVAGGTHGNEIGGMIAAILLVERARAQKGRLIVIPHANNSAASYTDARRPGPSSITLVTASGERLFKYGSRLTRREHQGSKIHEFHGTGCRVQRFS
jgi:hypothetical protein